MGYATQSDMVDRFGQPEMLQRTSRDDGLTIDAVVMGRALGDADAEINSYLAGRYSLPLASTPEVLVRMACDIARYRLYDDGTPESIRQRYEDAVSLLKRMASGEVQLGLQAPAVSTGADQAYHAFSARQITDDLLRGFA